MTKNNKIVFTNGCFDIIHVGHVDFLEKCKSYGDYLVVGLNSDDSVRELKKGSNRPINNEYDRKRVLLALKPVDCVIIFDGTPEQTVKNVMPNVLAKGSDWEGKQVIGRNIVEQNGGEIVFIPFQYNISTTMIIQSIQESNQ